MIKTFVFASTLIADSGAPKTVVNHVKLWVAVPDSILAEEPGLRDSTVKAGAIGRACAIFRVSRIYIYRDQAGRFEHDAVVLKTLLEYMETPQYLRRRLYGKNRILEFAGVLPPLRTPHHKLEVKPQDIQVGELREAVTVNQAGKTFADAGLDILVPLEEAYQDGRRVTVEFTSGFPNLMCRIAEKRQIREYWGYEVRRAPSLARFVRSAAADLLLLTSRKGRSILDLWEELCQRGKSANSILIAFGSAKRGVHEILKDESVRPEVLSPYVINMFPQQGTETVRTEEAILGALAIVNLSLQTA